MNVLELAILYHCLGAGTFAWLKLWILELKWPQVDFQRGVIDFNRQEQRSILDSGFSKGRTVTPMSALLRVALEEAKAGARSPFVIEWNGSRVADVKTGFIAAVRRAGLQGRRISPHVLRHASASWLADDNLDMRKIQRLLGHKSERTTERVYANKSAQSYLTEATDAIGARLGKMVGGERIELPTSCV
jgi:integrase